MGGEIGGEVCLRSGLLSVKGGGGGGSIALRSSSIRGGDGREASSAISGLRGWGEGLISWRGIEFGASLCDSLVISGILGLRSHSKNVQEDGGWRKQRKVIEAMNIEIPRSAMTGLDWSGLACMGISNEVRVGGCDSIRRF